MSVLFLYRISFCLLQTVVPHLITPLQTCRGNTKRFDLNGGNLSAIADQNIYEFLYCFFSRLLRAVHRTLEMPDEVNSPAPSLQFTSAKVNSLLHQAQWELACKSTERNTPKNFFMLFLNSRYTQINTESREWRLVISSGPDSLELVQTQWIRGDSGGDVRAHLTTNAKESGRRK